MFIREEVALLVMMKDAFAETHINSQKMKDEISWENNETVEWVF